MATRSPKHVAMQLKAWSHLVVVRYQVKRVIAVATIAVLAACPCIGYVLGHRIEKGTAQFKGPVVPICGFDIYAVDQRPASRD